MLNILDCMPRMILTRSVQWTLTTPQSVEMLAVMHFGEYQVDSFVKVRLHCKDISNSIFVAGYNGVYTFILKTNRSLETISSFFFSNSSTSQQTDKYLPLSHGLGSLVNHVKNPPQRSGSSVKTGSC